MYNLAESNQTHPWSVSPGSFGPIPRRPILRTASLGICAALAIACLAIAAPPVAAFQVTYDYYCYATNSDGIPVMDNDTLMGQWYVDGTYIKTGDYGNYGSCSFRADISTVTVSANAHSHGVQTGPYTFPSGTGRVENCFWRDRLFFTVPAGTYPDGVEVGISCWAVGTISSDVGAGATVRVHVTWEGEFYDTGLLEVGIDESGSVGVNEFFTLTEELVAPGETLGQAREYDIIVYASITNGRTWSIPTIPVAEV